MCSPSYMPSTKCRGWGGDNKKIAEEHFGSATLVQTATPGPKTTKSNTKKQVAQWDRSPGSQHNVSRHHNLRCSKADNSELETVTRN